MSSLGFQTIYREIHAHPDAAAERAFLPDDVAAWRESRVPLCTYESQQPLAQFACLAFSVSYELEITGLFEMLDLGGIPLLREERDERHPLGSRRPAHLFEPGPARSLRRRGGARGGGG